MASTNLGGSGFFATQEPNVRRALMDLERRAKVFARGLLSAESAIGAVDGRVDGVVGEVGSLSTFIDGLEFVDPAELGAQIATRVPVGGAAADINANAVTVNGGRLTAGSVTALEIASNAIVADKIAAGSIVASKLATNAIMSTNYSYTSGTFSSAGSFLNLVDGTFRTPGLFVDGSTGDVSVRGAVTASSLSVLRPGLGSEALTLDSSPFLGGTAGNALVLRTGVWTDPHQATLRSTWGALANSSRFLQLESGSATAGRRCFISLATGTSAGGFVLAQHGAGPNASTEWNSGSSVSNIWHTATNINLQGDTTVSGDLSVSGTISGTISGLPRGGAASGTTTSTSSFTVNHWLDVPTHTVVIQPISPNGSNQSDRWVGWNVTSVSSNSFTIGRCTSQDGTLLASTPISFRYALIPH